jgi:hypothetical protein
MKAAVVLSFVTAAVAGALGGRDGHCGGDNCARQVTGTRDGLSPISARKADCSSFQLTTVVPDATYVSIDDVVEVALRNADQSSFQMKSCTGNSRNPG